MSRKYVRSFVIGGLMGIAAGVILLPQVSGELKKRFADHETEMETNTSRTAPGTERR